MYGTIPAEIQISLQPDLFKCWSMGAGTRELSSICKIFAVQSLVRERNLGRQTVEVISS